MARVGPAMRAAGGMRVNRGRPGAWPSSVSSRSASQPRFAGLFVGRRSATAAVHAPGLRWHARAHGPLRASACKVIGPPAARMAFPPSRATRHPCLWRYRIWGSALARPVRTVGGRDGSGPNAAGAARRPPPEVIAYSVVTVPAT